MTEEIPDERIEDSIWEKMDEVISEVVGGIAVKTLEAALKRGQDIEIPSLGITIMHDSYKKDRHHE